MMEIIKKPDFRAQFFTRIQEIAAKEGFTFPKWKRGATRVDFIKPLTDGAMRANMFLDSKYLPRVEVYFHVYYPAVSEVLFDRIGIERPNFLKDDEGWRCASSRFGGFLVKKGLLEQEHATGTSFQLTDRGLEEAVAFVQRYYFELAARMIASDTDTMVRMDSLINGHLASLGYPDEVPIIPHCMYLPDQSTTGIALACILMRDDRQQLAECQLYYMENFHKLDQIAIAKILDYYVNEGMLTSTPKIKEALKYLT
jgi:hypothetical protein